MTHIAGANPSQASLLGSNIYLVGSGPEKIMIDSGDFNSSGFLQNFGEYLNQNNACISKILITHGHGDHFGGLHDLVSFLRSLGHKNPEVYKMFRKEAGGGALLYGPPGTGKTMIAKAIANEVGAAFYSIKASDIMSKWVGESEQNVKNLFDAVRSHALTVLFIDEIESITTKTSI